MFKMVEVLKFQNDGNQLTASLPGMAKGNLVTESTM